MATIGTYNEEGVNVDLYIPRKCHATNTLIASHDYSSVQIPIANVDANGMIDGSTTTFCIAGYLRAQGESDHVINHLAIERGIVRIKSAKPKKVGKKKIPLARSGQKPGAPGQRGAKPQGQTNAKSTSRGQKPGAPGQRDAKPQGQRGAKPQGQRGAKPQGQGPVKLPGKKGQAPRPYAPRK